MTPILPIPAPPTKMESLIDARVQLWGREVIQGKTLGSYREYTLSMPVPRGHTPITSTILFKEDKPKTIFIFGTAGAPSLISLPGTNPDLQWFQRKHDAYYLAKYFLEHSGWDPIGMREHLYGLLAQTADDPHFIGDPLLIPTYNALVTLYVSGATFLEEFYAARVLPLLLDLGFDLDTCWGPSHYDTDSVVHLASIHRVFNATFPVGFAFLAHQNANQPP